MSDHLGMLVVMALSDADRQLLELEGRWYRYAGAKDQAVHDELGISPTRYYQRLNQLLDDPDAYRADPALMKRLRRVRDVKRRDRADRRSAG